MLIRWSITASRALSIPHRIPLVSLLFTKRHHFHTPSGVKMVGYASPGKQGKLDGFVSGAKESNSVSSPSNRSKRPRSDGTDVPKEAKRSKASGTHRAFPANPPEPNEVGDGNETVLSKLEKAYDSLKPPKHEKGGSVVFWMRMKDLRLKDNKALSLASQAAKKLNKHLIILHVISPGDYEAHDRAPVRIDFVLRNLTLLQEELDTFNIPLVVPTMEPRKTIPSQVLDLCKTWSASHIFANLEYEVDELRRDIKLCELVAEGGNEIEVNLQHDYVVVKPGLVLTGAGKPYSVFSPFHRAWSAIVSGDLEAHKEEFPLPEANDDKARKDKVLKDLFSEKVPKSVPGFEITDGEYRKRVHDLFPAGTEAAEEALRRFVHTAARRGQFAHSLLDGDSPEEDDKNSRLAKYNVQRGETSMDGTSRLSPYLAAGVLSIRTCLRALLDTQKNGKLPMTRDTGYGSWAQELCFRDFYQHVMVAWPRVSMGRNFLLKLEAVKWDDDPDGEKLKAWEEGRTGFPFIDAGMRQMRKDGWMHNRSRMAVASFLVKDLMINWKEGERIFSRNLIDGDLGSNNAGWQWSASTGTDPQPYFRIFNPINQGEKFDPDGDYIRYYVPELSHVKGKAIHEPHKHLKISEFKATGYPKPIVDHAAARKKAIARFKNPGTTADE